MKLYEYISSQFKSPKGMIGRLISNFQNFSNRRMYDTLLTLLKLEKDEKILDIGFGNGHLLELIYKKQAVDMYGIDISADAKNLATKRNKEALAAEQLHLEIGDCCELPYASDMFSAVTTINTIYFWQDTLKGLQEIKRVLADGHSFYNVFYTKAYLDKVPFANTNYKKFIPDELILLGKEAGFSKIELVEIRESESYVIIYTK